MESSTRLKVSGGISPICSLKPLRWDPLFHTFFGFIPSLWFAKEKRSGGSFTWHRNQSFKLCYICEHFGYVKSLNHDPRLQQPNGTISPLFMVFCTNIHSNIFGGEKKEEGRSNTTTLFQCHHQWGFTNGQLPQTIVGFGAHIYWKRTSREGQNVFCLFFSMFKDDENLPYHLRGLLETYCSLCFWREKSYMAQKQSPL